MPKLNVLVAGSTGYIGIQLIKLLIKHDNVNIEYLCGSSSVGKNITTYEKLLNSKKLPKIDKYNKYVCLWCTYGLICRLYAPPNSWNCDYYIGGRRGEAHTAMSSSEHDHPSHAAWPSCTSYNGRRLV